MPLLNKLNGSICPPFKFALDEIQNCMFLSLMKKALMDKTDKALKSI